MDRGRRAGTTASQWLAGRKRGMLLTPAVVGTIDQLLAGGVASRHVALRFLGLTGKAVIIDEVHAYDAYMSVILAPGAGLARGRPGPGDPAVGDPAGGTRRSLLGAYAGAASVSPDSSGHPLLTWVGRPSRLAEPEDPSCRSGCGRTRPRTAAAQPADLAPPAARPSSVAGGCATPSRTRPLPLNWHRGGRRRRLRAGAAEHRWPCAAHLCAARGHARSRAGDAHSRPLYRCRPQVPGSAADHAFRRPPAAVRAQNAMWWSLPRSPSSPWMSTSTC